MDDRLARPPLSVNDALAELVHLQPQIQSPNEEPQPQQSPEEHPCSVSPPALELGFLFRMPRKAKTCETR